MAELKEKLFSEFPPVSTEEWMAKITVDLKGAPFEKKLVWKTGEGFNVNPFYRAEDIEGLKTPASLPGEFPYVRGTKKDNDWKVRQNLKVDDPKETNRRAKEALNRGADSLGFYLEGEAVSRESITLLLDGIIPEAVELNFATCGGAAEKLIGILVGYLKEHGADLNQCFGSVEYDPFEKLLVQGTEQENWIDETVKVLKTGNSLPNYRTLVVNTYLLSDAGAYITQELGYALAWGNELLSKLSDAGLTVSEIARKIKFNFGISSNYFMEIAKFRTARWLWAEIVAAYEPKDKDEAGKMVAYARTSNWNLTIYDAQVNLLRTQTETMSAALAGVDSISVTPFDAIYKEPDDFSERIARNQQLLLKEECHFDKVVDPSAGSYYVEVLTNSLADAAWKLFLETDEQGGFYVAIHSGAIQKAVNASNEARRKAVATRRLSLLGTNQFPNFTEMAADKIKRTEQESGNVPASGIPSLDFSRGASDFEKLRLATEKSGKTPKVFMLTIGNLAMRLARSQFSSNFFACAGYRIIDNLGFETVEAGVKAAREKKADVIVLCSSDDEYAVFAPEAYELVKGKELFVVAGAPACSEELKTQGIEYFINVKSNVLETLKTFNALLGIE